MSGLHSFAAGGGGMLFDARNTSNAALYKGLTAVLQYICGPVRSQQYADHRINPKVFVNREN